MFCWIRSGNNAPKFNVIAVFSYLWCMYCLTCFASRRFWLLGVKVFLRFLTKLQLFINFRRRKLRISDSISVFTIINFNPPMTCKCISKFQTWILRIFWTGRIPLGLLPKLSVKIISLSLACSVFLSACLRVALHRGFWSLMMDGKIQPMSSKRWESLSEKGHSEFTVPPFDI